MEASKPAPSRNRNGPIIIAPIAYRCGVAYIDKVLPEDATGLLNRIFQARARSAGRLWEIVAIQSLNAESLRESMRMYGEVMFGESPVSRAQREMIAVVTSQANDCHY